jgi:hypothetical protein
VDELVNLTIGKLADHYRVTEDYLRRALLVRSVAELNAVTDLARPSAPEELEQILSNMSQQIRDIVDGFRRRTVEVDDAIQHANTTLAVLDQIVATLGAEAAKRTIPPGQP